MDVATVVNSSSWNIATAMSNITCFAQEKAKYPGMDGYSTTIVQILCDNQQTALDTGLIDISDDGAKAIGDALGQNTALQAFDLGVIACSAEADCFAVLANALNTALKTNRFLRTLDLSAGASLYSNLSTRQFLHNLPCYNLTSFNFCSGLLTNDTVQDFSNVMQNNPYFPLTTLTLCAPYGGSMGYALREGLGKTHCLRTLDLLSDAYDASKITAIFQDAVGPSDISATAIFYDDVFCPPFSSEQKQTIIDAVSRNRCFLQHIEAGPCAFPPDLTNAIQNITQSRIPCPLDPLCSTNPSWCAPPPATAANPFSWHQSPRCGRYCLSCICCCHCTSDAAGAISLYEM